MTNPGNNIPASGERPHAVVRIRNRKGLHARASAKFVKCAEAFNASIQVSRDGQTVGGTSIMGLMMLAAGPGSDLHILAEGPEAPEAIDALVELIRTGFGEDLDG
jgi:phosphocarrier protein